MKTAAFLVVLPLLYPALAASQGGCPAHTADVPGQSVSATAGLFANLRNSAGSIKYEASKLLEASFAATPAPPKNLCPAACKLPERPKVIFKSVPRKLLSDYSDRAFCERRKTETEKEPISFSGKSFASTADLVGWYSDLSQGKGEDGATLYRLCGGDCSPQYTTLISKENGRLILDAFILCGPARDKDDNQFELTTAYRWTCTQ